MTTTTEQFKKMSELYNEGKSDLDIAAECNVCRHTVLQWRKKNGLKNKGHLSEEEEQKRMSLYSVGTSDNSIAKECNVSPSAIHIWRVSRGLPPTHSKGFQPSLTETTIEKLCKLVKEQCQSNSDIPYLVHKINYSEIEKKTGISSDSIRYYIRRRIKRAQESNTDPESLFTEVTEDSLAIKED